MSKLRKKIFDFRIILLLVISPLAACQVDQPSKQDQALVWVFCQFNIPQEDNEIETNWYFGSVSKDLYNKITNNELDKGFITLADVHYWTDTEEFEDVIEYYEDDYYTGTLSFRIEHIADIAEMTGPFEAGFSYNKPVNSESTAEASETSE